MTIIKSITANWLEPAAEYPDQAVQEMEETAHEANFE